MYSDEPESSAAQSSVTTDGTTRDDVSEGLGLVSIVFCSIPLGEKTFRVNFNSRLTDSDSFPFHCIQFNSIYCATQHTQQNSC
jgi:hypothetical protein